MEEFIKHLLTTEVNTISAAIKLGISFFLGAVIGIERQSRRQSAGLRTFAIICMASTTATLLSVWIPQYYPQFSNSDPSRIAAQLLTGIGFLGAGAIIQSRGSVHGLTTAACILLVAIIGMSVGVGMYIPATILTFSSLFVLIIVERWDRYRSMSGETKQLAIQFSIHNPDIETIKKILKKNNIYIYNTTFQKNYLNNSATYHFKIQISTIILIEEIIQEIKKDETITQISLNEI
jgi:putative Mg2+ transporter-C (MgtC) family protein